MKIETLRMRRRFARVSVHYVKGEMWNVEVAYFNVLSRTWAHENDFFFSWTLIQSFRIQLEKNLPTFDELNELE